MLSLSGISRSFSGREILHEVSCRFARPGVYALTGKSGIGKSTLLKIMAGIDARYTGEVRWDGRVVPRVDEGARADFRKDVLGVQFQDFALCENLSAVENVVLPFLLEKDCPPQCWEKAADILKRLALGDVLKEAAADLSGGERQRVAVARALVKKPPVILLDEPTANLDEANEKQVIAVLREMVQETGCRVIAATHSGFFAEQADWVLTLRRTGQGSVLV